jgi:hypothetical protein
MGSLLLSGVMADAGLGIKNLEAPAAVATFESIGLYLKYQGDENGNSKCEVEFRKAGENPWQQGLTLWRDRKKPEFRGSLVQLSPDTEYEIRLHVTDPDGGTETREFKARTWSEQFKILKRVTLPSSSNEPLVIKESGSAEEGYIEYAPAEGSASVIDVQNKHQSAVLINGAHHIILRGLTVKGGQQRAIQIENSSDIVIERCDISEWGRKGIENFGLKDGGIWAQGIAVKRLIIQRNLIHHPRYNTNNWTQKRNDMLKSKQPYHPIGAKGVDLINTGGNHVIRYNHFFSDKDRYFLDCIGGADNNGVGSPNCDSDIHGNLVEHSWDDGIEAEGANRNVRIWGNYIQHTYQAIATRSSTTGPLYIWRNVYGKSERAPGKGGGYFHKAGFNNPEAGDHGVHVFHNTVLQPNGSGLASTGPMMYTITRNNIFDAPKGFKLVTKRKNLKWNRENDFDYDLVTGDMDFGGDAGHEKHVITAKPRYVQNSGFDPRNRTGIFHLADGSPGYDAGVRIPNFNDQFSGKAPDMGAHEAGFTPMEFGPNATHSFPQAHQ